MKLKEFINKTINEYFNESSDTKYLKLQRGQTGEVEEPYDFNFGTGQHGDGVYAFMYGDKSMINYYTSRGENLHTFQIPVKFVVDLSNKNLDYWDAKAYIFNNPQYKAFIFRHIGHGIPSSKEVLIADPSIIEILK